MSRWEPDTQLPYQRIDQNLFTVKKLLQRPLTLAGTFAATLHHSRITCSLTVLVACAVCAVCAVCAMCAVCA
jgi:hypothetical protein